MRVVLILSLALAGWLIVAVIAFAILKAPKSAIGCGCGAVFCLFVAGREWAALREEVLWEDAQRHPRL